MWPCNSCKRPLPLISSFFDPQDEDRNVVLLGVSRPTSWNTHMILGHLICEIYPLNTPYTYYRVISTSFVFLTHISHLDDLQFPRCTFRSCLLLTEMSCELKTLEIRAHLLKILKELKIYPIKDGRENLQSDFNWNCLDCYLGWTEGRYTLGDCTVEPRPGI